MAVVYGTHSTLRKQKKQETREKLRVAAVDVFRQSGFANGRIEDITRTADVSRQTFYIHFESKEELLLEILRAEEIRLLVQYCKLASLAEVTTQSCAQWASDFIDLIRQDSAVILLLMQTVAFATERSSSATAYYEEVIAMLAREIPALAKASEGTDKLLHAKALLLFFQLEALMRYALIDSEFDQRSMCLVWGEQWADFVKERE